MNEFLDGFQIGKKKKKIIIKLRQKNELGDTQSADRVTRIYLRECRQMEGWKEQKINPKRKDEKKRGKYNAVSIERK